MFGGKLTYSIKYDMVQWKCSNMQITFKIFENIIHWFYSQQQSILFLMETV